MLFPSLSVLRKSIPEALIVLLLSLGLSGTAYAENSQFDVRVIVTGLNSPTGIAARGNNLLYFSEIPTPDVSGGAGGENAVKRLKLSNLGIATISEGEPNPVNLATDESGHVYWTCMTAGVILKYHPQYGRSFFLPADPMAANASFLLSPSGVAVDQNGDVLFTELPNPGVSGPNMVSVSDGENISLISSTEPAPTDIVVGVDGTAYWTCATAGVIVKRTPLGVISVLKTGLESPTGIALNYLGNKLYYTELPTPGLSGSEGGSNRVMQLHLETMETCVVAEGFPQPADVTVTPVGKVYWTCTKAGVIACATPLYLKNGIQL